MQPTQKQIEYAESLGIVYNGQDSYALSKQIDEARSKKTSPYRKPYEPKKTYDSSTMYVSYAKDLIVAGKKPEEAIAIIQQLKLAFS